MGEKRNQGRRARKGDTGLTNTMLTWTGWRTKMLSVITGVKDVARADVAPLQETQLFRDGHAARRSPLTRFSGGEEEGGNPKRKRAGR